MKESTRQLAIFVVILTAGIILVVFDIPFVYLVAGTAILCILVLILTGAVRIPKIRMPGAGAKKQKKEAVPGKTPREPEPGMDNRVSQKSGIPSALKDSTTKTGKGTTKASKAGRISGIRLIGDAVHEGFHIFLTDLSRVKKKTVNKPIANEKTKETGSLRDADVEAVPVVKRVVEDPFRDLVREEGDTELLDKASAPGSVNLAPFDGMDGFDGLDLPSDEDIAHADLSSVEESPQIKIDEESGDEVAEILESHKEELDPGAAGSEIAGFDELNSLDLGSIDLDEGIDLEGEPLPPPVQSSGEPETPSGGIKAAQPGTGTTKQPEPAGKSTPFTMSDVKASTGPVKDQYEQDSMLTFASGLPGDDDMISSLRTEVSQTKRRSNESLLRDLKDTRVPASDLAKELESVLVPKNRVDRPTAGKRTGK